MPPSAALVTNCWSAGASGAVDAVPLVLVVELALLPVAVPPVPLVAAALFMSLDALGEVDALVLDELSVDEVAAPVDGVVLELPVPELDVLSADEVDAVEPAVPLSVPAVVSPPRWQAPRANVAATAIADIVRRVVIVRFMLSPLPGLRPSVT